MDIKKRKRKRKKQVITFDRNTSDSTQQEHYLNKQQRQQRNNENIKANGKNEMEQRMPRLMCFCCNCKVVRHCFLDISSFFGCLQLIFLQLLPKLK